jgi:hypothetical protein
MAANAQLSNAPIAPDSIPPKLVPARVGPVDGDLTKFDPVTEEARWFENAKILRSTKQKSTQPNCPTPADASPQSQSTPLSDATPQAESHVEPPEGLNQKVGVAFSGGGVRSATFNLGVLQALASQGVLDKVGYISSVSGGSYINSWLASWISKEGFEKAKEALADHDRKTAQRDRKAEDNKGESVSGYAVQNENGDVDSNHLTSQSSSEQRYNRQRPISHLRHYSSYLTPHSGLLSSDVWAAVAAYTLRLAPNLLFVLLAAFTLICAPYLLQGAYNFNRYPSEIVKAVYALSPHLAETAKVAHPLNSYQEEVSSGTYTANSYIALTLAVLMCLAGLTTFYFANKIPGYDPDKSTESRKTAARHAIITFIAMLLIGPILAMAGVYTSTLYEVYRHPITESSFYLRVFGVLAGFFILAFLSALLFSRSIGLTPRAKGNTSSGDDAGNGAAEQRVSDSKSAFDRMSAPPTIQRALIPTAAIGAIFFALAALGFALCFRTTDHALAASALATVFGPSLLLLAYVGMASVGVAVLPYDSGSQEWLNRIWGNSAIFTLGWTAVAAISLLWPHFVSLALKQGKSALLLSGFSITGGWLLTTVSGILSAFSSKTSGPPTVDSTPTPWRIRTKQDGSQHLLENFLARISPYVFVAGLLLIVSSFVHYMVKVPLLEWLLVPFGLFLTIYVGKKIDVNRLSLHNFYRFRLIECYLAASRRSDAERLRLAELSPNLRELTQERTTEPSLSPSTGKARPFDGPFPILNCTLNVTKGDSLDLQKRRARNFVFSPTACGFTRFKDEEMPALKHLRECAMIPTSVCASDVTAPLTLGGGSETANPTSITLGAAMAISGAAQSPNQGSHTSPAVAALLTLANIRLGWWLGNPRHSTTFDKEGPDNGLRPMLDELSAQATDEKGYVYLSDGGHFENLGLYELIRRRCALIVLCDADCDPSYKFDDLVNAIELCEVDFGATITLDTDPLQNTLKAGWCRTAFTVGTIKYSEIDGKCETGTIVYLKSAVTRQNSMVVHSYDRHSKHFPHEPTTNQWFDETQFEAYRLLGLETATAALEAIKPQFPSDKHDGSSDCRGECKFIPPQWWNKSRQAWKECAEQAQKLLWSESELKEDWGRKHGSANSNNGGGNAQPNH